MKINCMEKCHFYKKWEKIWVSHTLLAIYGWCVLSMEVVVCILCHIHDPYVWYPMFMQTLIEVLVKQAWPDLYQPLCDPLRPPLDIPTLQIIILDDNEAQVQSLPKSKSAWDA